MSFYIKYDTKTEYAQVIWVERNKLEYLQDKLNYHLSEARRIRCMMNRVSEDHE